MEHLGTRPVISLTTLAKGLIRPRCEHPLAKTQAMRTHLGQASRDKLGLGRTGWQQTGQRSTKLLSDARAARELRTDN